VHNSSGGSRCNHSTHAPHQHWSLYSAPCVVHPNCGPVYHEEGNEASNGVSGSDQGIDDDRIGNELVRTLHKLFVQAPEVLQLCFDDRHSYGLNIALDLQKTG
jgi:hypothetical protein